ncbi:CYTH and CHAD domain-containing protein [Geodermatophilus ruber]|uniref:CHAD domain-containing protein n=1 Tax=Geodermatophilus ruber TaxID=504800 RepID=A0A1I4JBM9_9ACTN|nr:CYTH and CHAD domain-containing protein [Geodermatophilus ruber]SFL63526.1 CHAD domain-containing protein [Geodermatophilus ruber]
MSTVHLEIERKFEAGPSFELPDLAGLPGVAEVGEPEERPLEATYFDTDDLRLLRNRVTLRRRTGGPDAGWHVKLPSANGGRRELHQPLGPAVKSVPTAVIAPVLGLLGTATPGPVAIIRTRRVVLELRGPDGQVLAEVADDRVHGTAMAAGPGEAATVTEWRELEVELVDGDEALLEAVADRLLAAGARPSSAPSKLGLVLRRRLDAQVRAPEAGHGAAAVPSGGGATPQGTKKAGKKGKGAKGKQGKKAGKDGPATAGEVVLGALAEQLTALRTADLDIRTEQPEGVHDFRVACRRLRSILAAFRPLLPREHTDPLREELRWVSGELSDARDGEVALEHLRALVAAQPEELVLGPVAARIQQAEVQEQRVAGEGTATALSGRRYLRLLDALDTLLADPPVTELAAEPAGPVVADAVRRSGKRLRRAIHAAQEAEGADRAARLHDVRKAAKRLRYTTEVAAPIVGGPAADLVTALKEVQDVLGGAQDTVVTRAWCRRLGIAAFTAGENAWTYGRLHALEETRAAEATAAFWAQEPALKPAVRAVARRR